MSDLIDRQAAIEELSYCQTFLYDSMDKYPKIELGDAKAVLEALPTADLSEYCDKLWKTAYERGKEEARPKKGKWIVVDGQVVCSECYNANIETNYCPNCGARMEN